MATMKRLDRYFYREMIIPFLIGQAAVVLMLTGTVLYNNANYFLNYRIPALGVLKITFYFMPYLVHLTMPVAMALTASLAVSRLTRDSEITVMRAAGISLKRIFLPVFVIGILISLGDFYLGETIVPWANAQYNRTTRELTRDVRTLVPQARQVVQSPDRKYMLYVGRLEDRKPRARLYDVLIMVHDLRGRYPIVMLANNAEYDDGVITLFDARMHIYEQDGRKERYTRAARTIVNFRLSDRMFNALDLQLPLYSDATASMSARQLAQRIADQKRTGWVPRLDLLDYHFKLSVPFSCLVFAILCPPMALRFARAGAFMGVLLSIILVFVYWNTLLAAKILGARFEMIPPLVAGWGQHVLFSAIGLFFLWRGE